MDDNPITERQQSIDGLRKMADWLEAHPTAKAPCAFILEEAHSREGLVSSARELGGQWRKSDAGPWFRLIQELAPKVTIEIQALREHVCTRIITGSKKVEVVGPDPKRAVDS